MKNTELVVVGHGVKRKSCDILISRTRVTRPRDSSRNLKTCHLTFTSLKFLKCKMQLIYTLTFHKVSIMIKECNAREQTGKCYR